MEKYGARIRAFIFQYCLKARPFRNCLIKLKSFIYSLFMYFILSLHPYHNNDGRNKQNFPIANIWWSRMIWINSMHKCTGMNTKMMDVTCIRPNDQRDLELGTDKHVFIAPMRLRHVIILKLSALSWVIRCFCSAAVFSCWWLVEFICCSFTSIEHMVHIHMKGEYRDHVEILLLLLTVVFHSFSLFLSPSVLESYHVNRYANSSLDSLKCFQKYRFAQPNNTMRKL